MKKLFLICLLSLCALLAKAQDFEIVSVEHLPNDFAAREEMKTDHGDHQCALLRISTQKITPEQREGFTFKPDLGSEVVERATRNGEIWLWASPGLKYLRVMHHDWGQYELKLLDHVSRVESLHTYKIVIKGPEFLFPSPPANSTLSQQFLTFQITPTNALLEVEGELWEVKSDGSSTKFVDFGTYNYKVQAPNHHSEVGKVTVNDPENAHKVSVSLKPDFVEVTLKVDADAEIWVNNERKGVRTWTGNLGKGTYKMECRQANHETSVYSQEITEAMAGRTITLPAPTPIYGSLSIESTPNYATIFIDGKPMGETPKFVKEILVGAHEIRLSKEGCVDFTQSVTIAKGERMQVNATLADGSRPEWVKSDVKLTTQGDGFYDKKEYEKALWCYLEAAELPSEKSNGALLNRIGYMYDKGYGVAEDDIEAVKWFRKSADQGNAMAQHNMGFMYQYGKGVSQDYNEAVKWYRKSAEQGNADGQLNLGYMYEKGYGVAEDDVEAVKWYRKSADQGNATAQHNMGLMYQYGKGVSQDYNEAVKWYRKSAEQGNAEGQCDLGYMYDKGYGVAEDDVEAVKWYRKSAEQGNAIAQYNMGVMYENGEGIRKDIKEAQRWYKLAADQGHQNAIKALNRLK